MINSGPDKISLASLFPSEVPWSARQRCAAQRRAVLSPAPCHGVETSSHLYVWFYYKNIRAPFTSVGSGDAWKSKTISLQTHQLCLMSYWSVDSERPTLSRIASSHAGRQDAADVCRLTEIMLNGQKSCICVMICGTVWFDDNQGIRTINYWADIGTLLLCRGYKILILHLFLSINKSFALILSTYEYVFSVA